MEQIEQIIKDMFQYGDLLFVANKGIGKTNSLKVLAEMLMQRQDVRVIIVEEFPNWIISFNSIPYILIDSNDIIERRKRRYFEGVFYEKTNKYIDKNNIFKIVPINDTKEYWIQKADLIQDFLEKNKDVMFSINADGLEQNTIFTYTIIDYFYQKAIKDIMNGKEPEKVVFIIEESQNIFDYSIMGKRVFNNMRKIYNEARNLKLYFVMCTQRLQDISTKIRGRSQLLIGRVNTDDYNLKIKRLVKESKHKNKILSLDKGEFLYQNTDEIIKFPLFIQKSKPYKYEIQTMYVEPKKESIWKRIFG